MELLLLPIASALVMLAAFGLACLGLLQYRLAARVAPEVRVAATLAIVGIGAILSVTLMTRTLDEAQRAATDFLHPDDFAKGFAASRWLSLLLIGAAMVEALRGLAARDRRSRTGADPAWPLLAATLAFFLGTLLIQAVVSEHPVFSYKDLYLPIVLLAVYAQRCDRVDFVVTTAKWILLALTVGSLAAIAVNPDFVLHRPDNGVLPGIDWRLYGLTPHANALGPAALTAIVLELLAPSARRVWRLVHLVPAATVLLLAQSRMAWAGGAAIVLFVLVPLSWRRGAAQPDAAAAFRHAAWGIFGVVSATAVAVFVFVGLNVADRLQGSDNLTTLNGRLQIWDITLQAWRENPLFGYGSDVWGVDRQFRFWMFHVGHAHNQVVQTLGEAGLAGLLLLLLYIGVLLRTAVRRFDRSGGLLLALVIVLLARCVTEAPMRSEGLLTWPTFLHVLILVLACHAERTGRSPARRLQRASVENGRGRPDASPRPAAAT